ncbi:MAG: oligosaccharide flippase family protein [Gallionella sp.]|jgi:O-antigen/teichoic acid export membrane protein
MSESRSGKVIALSLGQALTSVVTLLTSVALARMLKVGDLATYLQTFLAYNIAAPILSLGLSFGLYYFLPSENKRARAVVFEALLIMFSMGIFYGLFIACGGNHLLAQRFSNPNIENTLLYLIPYSILTLPAGLLGAVLVVRNRVKQLTVFNILSNLVLGISIIAVCALWKNVQFIILTYVAVSLINGLIAIVIILRAVPDGDSQLRWHEIKNIISYSLPLALATMLGSIALQLDKFIVSAMCSPADFVIYTYGAVEIPLVGIITGAISAVILADMVAHCKNGDRVLALILFKKGAVRSALILFPVMAFLMLYADEFITILYTEKFHESVGIFRIYLLTLLIRVVMYGVALMALGKTRVVLWRSVGDLLINMIVTYVFVYFYGPYGAAWATVVTLFFWSVPFNLKMISKGFDCSWKEILPLPALFTILLISIISVSLSGSVTFLLNSNNIFVVFSLALLMSSGVYTLLIYRNFEEGREVIGDVGSKIFKILNIVKV